MLVFEDRQNAYCQHEQPLSVRLIKNLFYCEKLSVQLFRQLLVLPGFLLHPIFHLPLRFNSLARYWRRCQHVSQSNAKNAPWPRSATTSKGKSTSPQSWHRGTAYSSGGTVTASPSGDSHTGTHPREL